MHNSAIIELSQVKSVDNRIYSFPPVFDAHARALILGTMPSEASLRQGFYYAHPRNCFWPMISELLDEGLPQDSERKRALLIRHRLALWDVAHSCIRPGSLDSAIREPRANDVEGLLRICPEVSVILFNGGTAMRLCGRLLPGLKGTVRQVLMPSTSPAYTLPYERKRARWAEEIYI